MNTTTKRGVLAAAGTVSLVAGLVSAKAAPAAPAVGASGAKASASAARTSPRTAAPAAPAAPATSAASAPPAPQAGPGRTGTYTGDAVDVRYGMVQVAVTMSGGKITDVKALQLPSDRSRSRSISNSAAPVLRSEALQAQGANIDGVSGATYTSEGYAQSLQSAIDQARA